MTKKPKLPKDLLVYIGDFTDDGEPLFYVAADISEIPTDEDGNKIGWYTLNDTKVFQVNRRLV